MNLISEVNDKIKWYRMTLFLNSTVACKIVLLCEDDSLTIWQTTNFEYIWGKISWLYLICMYSFLNNLSNVLLARNTTLLKSCSGFIFYNLRFGFNGKTMTQPNEKWNLLTCAPIEPQNQSKQQNAAIKACKNRYAQIKQERKMDAWWDECF